MAAQAQSSVQVPREIRAEEVDIKSLRSLSYLLAVEWEALGGELDLSPAVLFNIKQNNQGNQGEITFKMLLKWQQMKGADATFGFLGDKLIVVGRADLVKDIHTWKTNDLR